MISRFLRRCICVRAWSVDFGVICRELGRLNTMPLTMMAVMLQWREQWREQWRGQWRGCIFNLSKGLSKNVNRLI